MSEPIPLELVGVRIELPSNSPIVLLREQGGTRYLPIWVGPGEATAIAYAIEGRIPERPMTHDLLKTVTETLGGSVQRVVVTELRDGIYHADLAVSRADDEVVVVSSRPSDAIALATRMSAPLFATPEVLDEAGVEIRDENEENEVARFREFLDDVQPEDFQNPRS